MDMNDLFQPTVFHSIQRQTTSSKEENNLLVFFIFRGPKSGQRKLSYRIKSISERVGRHFCTCKCPACLLCKLTAIVIMHLKFQLTKTRTQNNVHAYQTFKDQDRKNQLAK